MVEAISVKVGGDAVRRALAVMLLLVMLGSVVMPVMANKPKVIEQKPVKTIGFAKLKPAKPPKIAKPAKKLIPTEEDWKFVKDVMYTKITDFHILIG